MSNSRRWTAGHMSYTSDMGGQKNFVVVDADEISAHRYNINSFNFSLIVFFPTFIS